MSINNAEIIKLLKVLIGVVFVGLAVLSFTAVQTYRTVETSKNINEQNNRFLQNFSDYMRCLVINDDDVVVAVGEEVYFDLCDELLFRGTGLDHTVTHVTIPPDTPITTSSTKPDDLTGG